VVEGGRGSAVQVGAGGRGASHRVQRGILRISAGGQGGEIRRGRVLESTKEIRCQRCFPSCSCFSIFWSVKRWHHAGRSKLLDSLVLVSLLVSAV
jgi:hypothetical protein